MVNGTLENQLKGELQQTWIVHGAWVKERGGEISLVCVAFHACGCACVVLLVAIGQKAARRVVEASKLRMVEDIEGFGAKLGVETLADGKALEDAHVKVGGVRPEERVAT